ncbi:AraC family transcriptional regulator [Vibrio sp. M260118]|uniref:AraC family transcriptional regulator n=1 Tax=Vibrio sp. M260118 TaxID=3020896 RepID=UPI002F41EF39
MEYSAVYEPDVLASGILDVQLLTRYLNNRVPAEALLEGSGLSSTQLYSPETHITLAQKLVVFSNALRLSDEPDLGLKVGQQARFSDFGVLGYAAFSSNTLLDALLLGFKYLRLAGPVLRKKMWVENERGFFRAEQLVELDTLLPFCCEYWFAAIQNLCEEVMQSPFPSHLIKFPYPKPAHGDTYANMFQCRIEFNSPFLEWEFDGNRLNDPLPSANPMTLQMCLKSCDEMLAKVTAASSLKEQVMQIFVENPGNYPSIETLSSDLGMSSRTLRRHLKLEQTSYQQILDEVRFRLAKHYLASTDLNVEEIAERVGFSDSANFRQAFRRWALCSPKQYRLNNKQSNT